jgi:hypothetical protein
LIGFTSGWVAFLGAVTVGSRQRYRERSRAAPSPKPASVTEPPPSCSAAREFEAATHACTHPAYHDRYQHPKARIGKQHGAKVAQIDLARRLSEAIWHMLSRDQPFAPKGATDPLAA